MPCFKFTKKERICKKTEQEQLFSNGEKRLTVFPLRAVILRKEREKDEPGVKVLVAVPKKCFKRAVKRNRVKRQLREAYRHLKHHLSDTMNALQTETLLVAFVWMDNKLYTSAEVNKKMEKLLCRISELIAPHCNGC